MGESESADVVDKLVRAIGSKINGLNLGIWRRTAQSVISMRHPEVAYILKGKNVPNKLKFNNEERPWHANHRLLQDVEGHNNKVRKMILRPETKMTKKGNNKESITGLLKLLRQQQGLQSNFNNYSRSYINPLVYVHGHQECWRNKSMTSKQLDVVQLLVAEHNRSSGELSTAVQAQIRWNTEWKGSLGWYDS